MALSLRGWAGPSPKMPEVADQPQYVEHCLVLLAGTRLPVRIQAARPPSRREFCQLRDRDGDSARATSEPAVDVGFRPEDEHGASGESNVVPPLARWDQDVEDRRLIDGSSTMYFEVDALVTVGTRRVD